MTEVGSRDFRMKGTFRRRVFERSRMVMRIPICTRKFQMLKSHKFIFVLSRLNLIRIK